MTQETPRQKVDKKHLLHIMQYVIQMWKYYKSVIWFFSFDDLLHYTRIEQR